MQPALQAAVGNWFGNAAADATPWVIITVGFAIPMVTLGITRYWVWRTGPWCPCCGAALAERLSEVMASRSCPACLEEIVSAEPSGQASRSNEWLAQHAPRLAQLWERANQPLSSRSRFAGSVLVVMMMSAFLIGMGWGQPRLFAIMALIWLASLVSLGSKLLRERRAKST